MKCRSVACIWSGTVPSHRITAAAAMSDPPSLYTGGSDGSIVWWNLSDADSEPKFKPTAMLCGHTAPIVGLEICDPIAESDSSSSNPSMLFSACTDGMMCVWSRRSGHCRRRRKLPPWPGTPSMARALRSKPRYVCVACCFSDAVHLSDHDTSSVDSVGPSDASADRESRGKRWQKCSVVIVDTETLNVAQTVFHGNLSIGSLKFMAVVSLASKDSVVLSDSFGRVQMMSITECLREEKEIEKKRLGKNSPRLEMSVWEEETNGVGHIVAMASCGNVIAFVLETRCVFRLLESGATIGEISLVDHVRSHVSGCMFLEKSDVNGMYYYQLTTEKSEIGEMKFIVWNVRGGLILYLILYSNNVFTWKALCEVSVDPFPDDLRLSTSFVQLNRDIVRIESVCVDSDEPFHWKPVVSIYSMSGKSDGEGNFSTDFRIRVSRSSFIDWKKSSDSSCETEGSGKLETELYHRQHARASSSANGSQSVTHKQVVSSSMVIAETSFTPYAIVYGLYSGDIEVMRFDFFERQTSSHGESPLLRQRFSGHTGAVLCLAAHHMVITAKGSNLCKVLVSGSKDCTVRIWDLDTGNIITVMHQHVAPVRQIILPPIHTEHPWSDCFLSVGDDFCVTLVSFETLRVERMFPGHPNYPAKVVWDGMRGYIACLCPNALGSPENDALYFWDVKTGARERILRGTDLQSMFDNFCKGIRKSSSSDNSILNINTSVSSLSLPIVEDGNSSGARGSNLENSASSSDVVLDSHTRERKKSKKYAIKCSCPFPGIAALCFDLTSLMFNHQKNESMENNKLAEQNTEISRSRPESEKYGSDWNESSFEESMIRFSLSFLHSWDVDRELDYLLLTNMKLKRPNKFIVASAMQGDHGSVTLAFPDSSASLELWKSSSEFCAIGSLTMVSLAQRMISLSHSSSSASIALAAFYTRNFAEKFPDIKPPLLQLLVSFWQHKSEHIRMASRTLFHCAASRAIPTPLCGQKSANHTKQILQVGCGESGVGGSDLHTKDTSSDATEQSDILAWLESNEIQDWISFVGAKRQHITSSHIIVAAALAIWYPSLVKPCLATLVVHPLMKLVMAMTDKYSSTAAELLAEGMESTWKVCISSEIPRLIGDIFFQIECVSGGSKANPATPKSDVLNSIRETLVGILLPSLAMADVQAFLTIIEHQVWSMSSDSSVHVVSLMILMRVVRGSPKNVVQYLDKVVSFIILTMDPHNSVLRKTCDQISKNALSEVVKVFPMVAMNEKATRLAIGDVLGEIKGATIRVYELPSGVKMKVLDASAPPGLPSLLAAPLETLVATAISALSFSPDGEGLVAFSEHGLMIRWWSLGSLWWEKLTRNLTPVQCTKLILVPPWEGFSTESSRSSIMASIMEHDNDHDRPLDHQDSPKVSSHPDNLKLVIHNLDLSYRIQWVVGERKIILARHGNDLGTYPL